MDNTALYYGRLTLVLLLLLMASLAGNLWQWHLSQNREPAPADTVHVVEWYERKVSSPVPSEERPTGRTLTVKVKPTAIAPADTSTVHPADTAAAVTCSLDSDSVATITLPVMQRVYRDSSYTAWVSGFAPQLDSITVRNRLVTVTVTRWKQRHWHWGVGISAGVSVFTRQPDVTAGLWAGYSF